MYVVDLYSEYVSPLMSVVVYIHLLTYYDCDDTTLT